jgi:predicted transcriptional regulator
LLIFTVNGIGPLGRAARASCSPAIVTTLRVGIATLEQYKQRTLAIARGQLKPAPGDPKVWFSSIESFAKVLSEHNRELLRVIAETKPQSLNELAEVTGRAKSNLSRTLKTMERYGLVQFEKGKGRTLARRTLVPA